MAQTTKQPGDEVPLPDPDLLQKSLNKALEELRQRRGFYISIGLLALAIIVAAFVWVNQPEEEPGSGFNRLWVRCQPVRDRLSRDLSAARELSTLEDYLEEIRGSAEEGYALWLLGNFHYAEAYTPEKGSFQQQSPHLEKAASYFQELEDPKFDSLLLAKPRWFTDRRQVPIEAMAQQATADLAWGEKYAQTAPQPDEQVVAVLRTGEGDVHLQFYRELAPKHTEQFITLATAGGYNGTQFHFVRGGSQDPKGVMGGDPYTFFYPDPLKEDHILRWGHGGVGYDIAPEPARFKVVHQRGIVTSQRVEKADWDNAVQFQILLQTDRGLDRIHTPFAQVVEGMGLIEKIARKKTAMEHDVYKGKPAFQGTGTRDLLVEPTVIHKVLVFEDGKALDHSFPLDEGEKSLSTLAGSPVTPLPENQIYCGRLLYADEATAEERSKSVTPVPFPQGVDPKKADPKGEREDKDE
jgi:peptidyl-prolyl cis-trans isomerase B (cyclophilin B)